MRLLAMDTSTSAITAAVLDVGDEPTVLASRSVLDARRHTELLAPMLLEVLAESGTAASDITHVAVGTGPGPFTGLRVGLVTARTFAHARGVTVHGVCSLDALAAAAARSGHEGDLLVATDARRKEVYWARYRCDGSRAERLSDPAVDKPADLPAEVRDLPTVGRGPVLYPELLAHPLAGEVLDVDAGVLAALATDRITAGADMPVEPLYLRRPDAAVPAAPKAASPPQQQRRREAPGQDRAQQ